MRRPSLSYQIQPLRDCWQLCGIQSAAVQERAMANMRAVQVTSPNGPFEMVERAVPEPRPREVRVKVQACGICHSDSLTKMGIWPGIKYPRVPGHEIAGVIDAVGREVPEWRPGQRVGVGWHGGHCGYCPSCRRGDFVTCRTGQIPGITYDGGYADYVVVPFEALAAIPDLLSGGCRSDHVRRHYNLQLAAQQRRAWWRSGRGSGHWRSGTPRGAVRRQDGLPHRGHRARRRQGGAGQAAGSSPVH